ncbi:hypothetical protein BDN71DRAFT_1504540 [Pleurotus eryngii]|uniref:Uncharacterized protein n=1 Tax=Pleurotus eryngii TaxID=5323 RepID=A0A9P6A2I8_PLEER|nr:hypothetical protein BDN71DRAFT_1504540 [Pleurotus eryngii]
MGHDSMKGKEHVATITSGHGLKYGIGHIHKASMYSNATQIEEYNKICDFLDSQSLFLLEPDPRRWKFLPVDVLYHAFVLQAQFWCSIPYVLAAILRTEPVERLFLIRRLVISFDGCDSPINHSPYLDWLLNNLPNLESIQLQDSTRSFTDDYLTFFHRKPPEPIMNDLNANC